MNIESLNLYMEVIKHGSISKAANHAHVSQPALSQQLRLMENEVGFQLLERSNKGVHPTEAGQIVFSYAQEIQSRYEAMMMELERVNNPDQNLTIISNPVFSNYALPCTLYQMKKKFPLLNLEMGSSSSNDVENKILYGEGDIGFIVGQPKNNLLMATPVFKDTFHLVAGSNIKIPDKISLEDLYKYPLIMLNKSQKTREYIDTTLEAMGIDINKIKILYCLNSTESIKLSTIKNFGIAFIPYMAIKKELYQKQLRIIEIEHLNFEIEYHMITREDHTSSNHFLTEITKYLQKVIKDTIC